MAKGPLTKEQWGKQGISVPSEPQTPDEKTALIDSLGVMATHINVCDAEGCSRWRKMKDVRKDDIVVFRKNGLPNVRYTKPKVEADGDKSLEIAERKVRQESFLQDDSLVRVANHSMDPDDLNRQSIIRMAEIASLLKFEREEAEKEGASVVKMLQQEMRATKILSDAASKQVDQNLKRQEIDLGSLAFRNLLVKMLETFHHVMTSEGLSSDKASLVVTQMSGVLNSEEWQTSLQKVLAGS